MASAERRRSQGVNASRPSIELDRLGGAVMSERLSELERWRIAELASQGSTTRLIAKEIGRGRYAVAKHLRLMRRPPARESARSALRLSLGEREEISRGLAGGESLRAIARRLGRAPSTISRDVAGNGGRRRYRACRADKAAVRRLRRPKSSKLASCPRLRRVVEAKLELRWSPQQISGWLVETFPDDPEMRVSHETIYLSLFVQSRGALRKELTRYLRSGHSARRPRGYSVMNGQGQLRATLNIRERPAEANDRAVPGHWEGDLLMGKGMRAIATLVERKTRFVMLIALPGGHAADVVADALAAKIVELPDQLRRSLTWDQGKEMAAHAKFSVNTGVPVYFCDPRSPWQRGSNENTNGLLRQYFPKRTEIAHYSQAELDAVATELNGRPRQTLGWKTPSETLDEALR
jgi:IS30 family transposase